ncbi:hypothetical protein ET445_04100 [Agromyces protaetiae]|uniref:P/Homo B domain-containing protein n=1 Tax=Agromyces protaetiae TaxID=2509455 RepID=A0A4P6FE29_9MICO|nr:hypothetical protein ET445_04100 [Agromyces protaetiae]
MSGLPTSLSKVTATLSGVSHSSPIDLDILLVGPAGQNVMLLSDAGGGTPVANATITFDDAGGVLGALATGTFQPVDSDAEGADVSLPAPAPVHSGLTALSTFAGTNPNGTWSLFVVDDATGDSGSIAGGWCLTITSPPPAPAPTSTVLVSSVNPSTEGQSVTFTATVASAGIPVAGVGFVQFGVDGTPAGEAVLLGFDGTATLTTSALAAGSHTITADYGGSPVTGSSSGSLTQVVEALPPTPAATSTELTSSVNPSTFGQSVTFNATITSSGLPVSGAPSSSATAAPRSARRPPSPTTAPRRSRAPHSRSDRTRSPPSSAARQPTPRAATLSHRSSRTRCRSRRRP